MYSDFNENNTYKENDNMNQSMEQEPKSKKKKRFGKKGIAKKATSLILSAVLFGGVAGGTFYGVNEYLTSNYSTESSSTQQTGTLQTASYSSDSDSDSSASVSDIASLGLPSVVSVTNISVQEVESYFNQFGHGNRGQVQTQETTSVGSGVIISTSDDYLYMVTNYHVVEEATTLSVTFVDDETAEAELCGYDDSVDIAVLKVAKSDMTSDTLSQIAVATVGDSDDLTVGEQVVAIGNALGYGQSVTTGIVSALDRTVSSDDSSDSAYGSNGYGSNGSYGSGSYGSGSYDSDEYGNPETTETSSTTETTTTYIQTDAAINPGNSGGALFDMNGELIGINTAKVSSTDVEGMGYAIPISDVMDLIESYISES